MLNKYWSEAEDRQPLENCKTIEADTSTVREVMRGIAMDDELKGPEPWIKGLSGGFTRRPPGS